MDNARYLRWKSYTYHMYDKFGKQSNAYVALYSKSSDDLATMVIEAYRGAVEERNPSYKYMFESFIQDLYFPCVSVPSEITKKEAIKIMQGVEKAWMIEYIYHSQFARITNFPEEPYVYISLSEN